MVQFHFALVQTRLKTLCWQVCVYVYDCVGRCVYVYDCVGRSAARCNY
jgi:hypothetical protein